MGIAVPGLKESLDVTGLKEKLEKENKEASDKLAEKDVEIPDYVELTADVRNFEMPTVFTLATSNLLSNAEIDTSDIVEQVDKKLKEMMSYNVAASYSPQTNFPGLYGLCAKTGTAEVGDGAPHAWFTGFLDDAAHPYAFVVFIEHGGAGLQNAGPAAAAILRAAIAADGR